MLTIACSGGIGDGLRNLSLIPHELIHQRTGLRCRVVTYQIEIMVGEVAHSGRSLAHANFPKVTLFRDLVLRCPSLRWCGEMRKVGLGLAANRALRETIKLGNGGHARYFPFALQLNERELAALPERGERPLIGIQTHLSGMRTKQWGIENWRVFLSLLIRAVPTAQLILFDSDPAVVELATSASITTTCGLDIAQSICLVPRLDFLVSVDSWTKYIAAAHRVRQIVVVPDQRSEYPEFPAENFVQKSFAGLMEDPTINLLGLKSNPAALTLPSMADLKPETLAELTLSAWAVARKAPLSGA